MNLLQNSQSCQTLVSRRCYFWLLHITYLQTSSLFSIKILFEVYNQGNEINPDYLVENKIRIVDENQKIGFANEKGQIIIKPQFEMVTSFHNGKAIIAESCEKIPWKKHTEESDCKFQ